MPCATSWAICQFHRRKQSEGGRIALARGLARGTQLGIPPQHPGMASGFLMTGHEVGAAPGVAVLSAVATTAGSLTSPAGIVAGFSRGFIAAAVIAATIGVVALLRMSATPVDGGAGGMHGH
jgi:hypothetical protein